MPGLAALRPMLAQMLPALKDVQFEARLTVPANVGSKAFKIVEGDHAAAAVARWSSRVLVAFEVAQQLAGMPLKAADADHVTHVGIDPTFATSAAK